MKKITLIIIPIIFFLFSCSFEEDKPEIIVDHRLNDFTVWEEIERRVGAAKWKIIAQGNTLVLDSTNGVYDYKFNNLKININKEGNFSKKNDLLSFSFTSKNGKTDVITTKCKEDGNTLIIKNILEVPNIEVKYRKIAEFKYK